MENLLEMQGKYEPAKTRTNGKESIRQTVKKGESSLTTTTAFMQILI
ncbi:hypothetical protein M5D96_005288 [Drosophila gunungcola]|uniref:Uncharacterized protein n=1 Tax=Drosophila gunungcola TaxID=103775 RepID=A0A9P9YQ65_9MUSC|nr:hypothetical protein M5D96_005288 [Drosophila gunungcola]